ncbi:antibiotic biosynthesis monooxygenase [Streptomyces erythrochromogenes]|uniref:Antibiotic biosynthesis monooxygenase n=1 Tax=Streptomyces erythrochromogenes TaxID=285574 RepID=A0ABZ1QLH3_9ACTN|nr:antibiotic biosynthesis monooxygenase [Streptomyces erythrochromogenes]MCX5589179.1 antibiotic biosynthesis monooxygenase [Streptomyces erythrochromogenes]
MSFGFVAFHYPAPEHVEEFVAECHQVAEAMRRQPGFVSVGVWVTPDGDAVVTTGAFESEEAFRATADLAREMGATPDGLSDLEIRPREVHFLVSR